MTDMSRPVLRERLMPPADSIVRPRARAGSHRLFPGGAHGGTVALVPQAANPLATHGFAAPNVVDAASTPTACDVALQLLRGTARPPSTG